MSIFCKIALQYIFKHKPQYNITRTQNLHKEIIKMKYITNEQEYIFETLNKNTLVNYQIICILLPMSRASNFDLVS